MVLCPYVTQRWAAWWPEPDEFDPTGFAPGNVEAQMKFAYFPFGGGPRLCIGNNFALMEAQLILAMTAQKFRLERDPQSEVRRVLYVSCMAHGLRLPNDSPDLMRTEIVGGSSPAGPRRSG